MIAILVYGGLIVYFLIGILVARYIAKFGESRSRKWLLVISTMVVWFLILYGDVIVGTRYLHHVCAQDAGAHVYETIEGIDGFYLKHGGSGEAYDLLINPGYKYIEAQSLRNQLVRYTLDESAELVATKITAPKSQYIAEEHLGEPLALNTKRYRQTVKNRITGEILGENIYYIYFGGWIDNIIIKRFLQASATYCPSPPDFFYGVYTLVLKPGEKITK